MKGNYHYVDRIFERRAVLLSSAASDFGANHYYGYCIAVGDNKGKVWVIDPMDKKSQVTFDAKNNKGHSDGVMHLKFSDKDPFVLFSSARRDNHILGWDIRKPTEPVYSFERESTTQ